MFGYFSVRFFRWARPMLSIYIGAARRSSAGILQWWCSIDEQGKCLPTTGVKFFDRVEVPCGVA
jgi:hypothetical protein